MTDCHSPIAIPTSSPQNHSQGTLSDVLFSLNYAAKVTVSVGDFGGCSLDW